MLARGDITSGRAAAAAATGAEPFPRSGPAIQGAFARSFIGAHCATIVKPRGLPLAGLVTL
jgi:hypothetical protein